MSFKQIRKNAAKNRKSSGLFFGSLIIAIIAFYTLLSMENQDVIRFLKTLESDAVGKLMGMIPVGKKHKEKDKEQGNRINDRYHAH